MQRISASRIVAYAQANLALIGAWSLMIGAAYYGYRETNHLLSVVRRGAENQAQVATADQLLTLLKDAETGQRGYLLTGRPHYLQPYESAVQQIDLALGKLFEVTASDPMWARELPRVRELVRRKMRELAATIDARNRQGFEAAQSIVLTDEGSRLMSELRSMLDRHRARLRSEFVANERQSRRLATTSALVIVFSGVLALAWMTLSTLLSKRERRRRLQAEAEVQHFFDLSPDMLAVVDRDGTLKRMNPAGQQMLGYGLQELLSLSPFAYIHPDDRLLLKERRERALMDPNIRSQEGELRYVTKTGSVRWLLWNGHYDRDTRAVYGVGRDITKRKQKEAEIVADSEAARAGSRAKSDFLARMSHEIRTPMNGVLGMVGLALQTDLTHEQRDYLDNARESAETLLSIINDILDLSKIDAGKLRVDAVPFSLRECVGAALRSLAHRAHAKRLELLKRIPIDVPDRLIGDPGRIRQILTNLVSNAVKFTSQGEVTVAVTSSVGSTGSVTLTFTVTDTGIGIPAEGKATIFEAFNATSQRTAARFGGTGLGLSICAQLVRMMDGHIGVDSQVGVGSRFYFQITLPIDVTILASGPAEEDLTKVRALVVDDHAGQREALIELLHGWGMRAVATDGTAAQTAARQANEAADRFGLLLLDVDMPGIDTLELGRSLRKQLGDDAPIILLTLAGAPVDGGMQAALAPATQLVKPILSSALLECIHSLQRKELAEGRADLPQPPPKAERSLRVLVADDNAMNRRIASAMLEKRGHSVVLVENGLQVVEAVRAGEFDIVLMDVLMPELNGLEATRRIRDEEVRLGGHIPIVALTAEAMKGDDQRCFEAGMDAYLTKPLRANELFATLQGVTEHRDPLVR